MGRRVFGGPPKTTRGPRVVLCAGEAMRKGLTLTGPLQTEGGVQRTARPTWGKGSEMIHKVSCGIGSAETVGSPPH